MNTRKRFDIFWPVAVLSIAVSLTAACGPTPAPVEPTTPPPTEESDASVLAGCKGACSNLRAHHCPLGDPTPKGGTCEQVCDNVRINNGGVGFPAACLSRAKSCALADACR